ncbi:MAG TPA: hypothetical protein VF789_34630 [Thermoanaerobaculia bacterium]
MNGPSLIYRRCVPLAILAAAALGCVPGGDSKKAVVPVATPEAIALIQDNRDRCAKLGETGLTLLQSAERAEAEWTWTRNERRMGDESEPSRPPEASEVLKDHLEGDAAPEVAAAKRASELIDKLLPKIAEETSPQVAQAVDALNRAQEELCDRVTQKDASAWTYERNRRRAVETFESAEAKLEALYRVNPTDLQFAMRKYNPLLEQARSEARQQDSGPELTPEEYADQQAEWEAAQELQTAQQAEHDVALTRWKEERESEERPEEKAKVGFSPDYAKQLQETPETRQRAFQSWYPSYTARVTPVRQALAHYVDVRRGPQSQVQPACQAILDATAAMLNDSQALQVPDKILTRTLKQAYENLQQGASACVAGRTAEAAFRMTDYEKGIKEATSTLSQYSMLP